MPVGFTWLSPRLLVGALVWLGGFAFLVHYLKAFRKNLADLRESRDAYLAAPRGRPRDAADARRDLIGEAVAFGALFLVAVLAALVTVGGLVWFFTQVIGGLRDLLR